MNEDRLETIWRAGLAMRGAVEEIKWLRAEVERLTRERDEARAEVERLREVIRTIRARCVEMDDSDAVSETLDISSAALEDEP